jgi:DNA-binding MarR family transcriptional regulator
MNITPVQYAILTTLSVMPGLDQTALAQEVGLDRTNTADVVKRLETHELIYRQPDPNDRRTRNVFLTPQGKEAVVLMHESMARAQERMLQPLRPAQKKQFMGLLAILVESNNQYSRTVLRGL